MPQHDSAAADAATGAPAPQNPAASPEDAVSFLDAVGAAARRRRRAITIALLLTLGGLCFFLALLFGLSRGFDRLARQTSGSLSGALAPAPPLEPRAPPPPPAPAGASGANDLPPPPGL
ncbi:MAG: hypothetical protein IPL40_09785 [Proteobacteria bacterium]|nr:hypothetical protein [Pseudomonadota bacterium]